MSPEEQDPLDAGPVTAAARRRPAAAPPLGAGEHRPEHPIMRQREHVDALERGRRRC
jgi:hypothetical protein